MRKLLFVVLGTLIFISCDEHLVASDTTAIQGAWDKENEIQFSLPQMDSLENYHLFLNVRNTNDYPFNNLYLIVSMDFPFGKTITDTLEYRMANPDGSWLGNGIGGVKENKLWYKENVAFFEPGNYQLRISQAVRNNGEVGGVSQLQGITDVGYSIEKASK